MTLIECISIAVPLIVLILVSFKFKTKNRHKDSNNNNKDYVDLDDFFKDMVLLSSNEILKPSYVLHGILARHKDNLLRLENWNRSWIDVLREFNILYLTTEEFESYNKHMDIWTHSTFSEFMDYLTDGQSYLFYYSTGICVFIPDLVGRSEFMQTHLNSFNSINNKSDYQLLIDKFLEYVKFKEILAELKTTTILMVDVEVVEISDVKRFLDIRKGAKFSVYEIDYVFSKTEQIKLTTQVESPSADLVLYNPTKNTRFWDSKNDYVRLSDIKQYILS
jgi:hypothetical protein